MPDASPLMRATERVVAVVAGAAMREAFWTAEDTIRDGSSLDVVGARVRDSWRASLDGPLAAELRLVFTDRLLDVAPDADPGLLWEAHWPAAESRLALFPDGLLRALSEALRAAQEAGSAQAGLWAAVDQVLEDGPEGWRVQRMARTEALTAVNAGAYAGALLTGAKDKTWQSLDDPAVRPEHERIDGATLPLATPFLNGGQYPGDPELPASERVNCRCLLLIEGQPAPSLTAGADTMTKPSLPTGYALSDQGGIRTALQAAAPGDVVEILPVGGPPAALPPPTTTPGSDPTYSNPPTGWRGVLAPLGVMSSDGRLLGVPTELRTRPLPMQMGWQKESSPGHDGAVVNAARIDRAWVEERDGRSYLMGEGAFDMAGEEGSELSRAVHEGFAAGVSVDLSDATVEWRFVLPDGTEVAEPESFEEWIDLMEAGATEVAYFIDWELGACTFVNIPSFGEARVQPAYDYQPSAEIVALVAAGGITTRGGAMPGEHIYDAALFADPKLDGPTPLTITADGRVFGHAGLWKSCHIGYANTCQRPPQSRTGYAAFHLGEVLTTDGPLAVGPLTVGGGHAGPDLSMRAALAHYDDVANKVAVVRAGEDAHGVWVSGSIIKGTHPDQVSALRSSPLSGDWRAVNGNLEMVIAHAVNVPGFGVPRAMAASAGDRQISLVAAAVPPHRTAPGREHGKGFSQGALAAAVVDEMERRQADRQAVAKQKAELATRVGLDKNSRVARLAARVGLTKENS